jgi:hypothetical protein
MWLFLSTSCPMMPITGAISAGVPDLPDWHGNAMRSHQGD